MSDPGFSSTSQVITGTGEADSFQDHITKRPEEICGKQWVTANPNDDHILTSLSLRKVGRSSRDCGARGVVLRLAWI